MITQINGSFYMVMPIEKEDMPLVMKYHLPEEKDEKPDPRFQRRICWFSKRGRGKQTTEWKAGITEIEMEAIRKHMQAANPDKVYFVESEKIAA